MVSRDQTAYIAELEARLRDVENLSDLGFWEWHIAEDRNVWSDSLYRIFGFEPGEFAPTYERWLERIHPDDRDQVHETVQTAFAERASYVFDHRIVWPDGTVRRLHARGHVLTDDSGEPERIAGITYDVTDRRETEERLQSFIADAAHELRTPVTVIRGAVDLLARAEDDPAALDIALGILERQVTRLGELTTTLLDLEAARPTRSHQVLRDIDLATAVGEAVASVHAPTGAVTIDLPEEPLIVKGVPQQIERVLVNLLSNAIAHGGDGVRVDVRARGEGGRVVVDVSDDGVGIDPEQVSDLFRPFSRGTEAVGVGSGLGLAMARRLVESLGGSLEYRPNQPQGAIFRFALLRSGAGA